MTSNKKSHEHTRLSALEVYSTISLEAMNELDRPKASLWWSGVGAGFAIAASVVARTVLHDKLPDSDWRLVLESFGYCVGFIIVILGRMQLFTENTITVILPLMVKRTTGIFLQAARLWGIVITANVVGAVLAALLAYYGYFSASQAQAAVELSQPLAAANWHEILWSGIPAGFLIASVVWMLPSSRGFEIWVIVVPTYIIAVGGFAHVVVGTIEVSLLLFVGQMSLFDSIFGFLIPAFVGNVLGGTALFSLLAFGQIHNEIE